MVAHSSFENRSADDIVIAATGSLSATGRNVEGAHDAAVNFRTGLRPVTPADVTNFELMCELKHMCRLVELMRELGPAGIVDAAFMKRVKEPMTDAERQEFFRCLWGDKCGVGGTIPREFIPPPGGEFRYPEDFFKRGELKVGTPVLLAFIAFAEVRQKLKTLFPDGQHILSEYAPETMIDIANGAGSATEMVERELMRLLRAPLSERLGMEYGGKWLLGMLGNMIAGQLAADAGIEGAQVSSNSACASSGLSLVNGCNAIRAGQADIAVVGGSEYVTGPSTTYVSFDHMMFKRGALTRDWRKYGEAANALRAFDAVRDGFVPGDAAVLIVLMRRRVADVLGIQPLARVLGVATNTCQSDKYGKSLADGTITGQAALLARLFEKSGIDARHLPGRLVHFLHGTGTKVGGINEVYAAAHAVGDIAREGRYVATGIKERDGHTLGAAFAGNISAAIEAIRHKIVPGLPSTREVDPELRTVKSEVVGREKVEIDPRALCAVADSILCHRHAEVEPERDIVIADAKGFGGTNAAVAIRGER